MRSACKFLAKKSCFGMHRTDDVKRPSLFQLRTNFCRLGAQSTFMTADSGVARNFNWEGPRFSFLSFLCLFLSPSFLFLFL